MLESIGGFISKDIVDQTGVSQYIVDIVNKNSKYINILIPNTIVEQLNILEMEDQEIVIRTWGTTDNKVVSSIANTLPEYLKSDNTPEYRHPVFIENYNYDVTTYDLTSLVENFDEVTIFKYFVEGGLSSLLSS